MEKYTLDQFLEDCKSIGWGIFKYKDDPSQKVLIYEKEVAMTFEQKSEGIQFEITSIENGHGHPVWMNEHVIDEEGKEFPYIEDFNKRKGFAINKRELENYMKVSGYYKL